MGSNWYDNRHWMNGHMGWGGWLAMGLVLFLCLAVLLTLVVWITSSAHRPATGASAATALLDACFARGEIDEEEYLKRRHTLELRADLR